MATQINEPVSEMTQETEQQPESHRHEISQSSSEIIGNQNRLIQYIRSMPLISVLFSRNVSSDSMSNATNRAFIFKCLLSFHLLILVCLIALTSFAIYYYNIRFYKIQTRPSETLILCWLLRGIWHTINSSWSLRYHYHGIRNNPNLRLSQTFYNVASILWISLTVVFLGVSPREDLKSVSSRLCYFLLWITIASYVVPMLAYTFICILLYLTLLIVIYFRHGSIPISSTSMPMSFLKKLKVERYRDVLKRIEKMELGGTSDSEISTENEKSDSLDYEVSADKTKDGLNECVNNTEMLNDRLCSICILNIDQEDKVFLLPCDMRHLFHRDCLKKWFKRSSECPICRTNITQVLSSSGKKTDGSVLKTEDPASPADESSDHLFIEVVIHPCSNHSESQAHNEVRCCEAEASAVDLNERDIELGRSHTTEC